MPRAPQSQTPPPAACRTFRAPDGSTWSVWRVDATLTSTGRETTCAWLLFEDAASGERRALADVPRHWERLTGRRLDLLRRVARPTPGARRGATG